MTLLNWRAVLAGFLLALALTLVGFVTALPALGLFAGIAAGSYLAASRAGAQGVIQGAGVAVLMLVAVIVMLVIGHQTFPSMDSVNAISLAWAAAVLLLVRSTSARQTKTKRSTWSVLAARSGGRAAIR